MGHQSNVYGVIDCFKGQRGDINADDLNRSALAELPEHDGWPFLVRSMFAMTSSEQVTIDYMYRLMHFAASYKEVEFDWAEWLSKFESFLARVDGMAARVHLETVLVGDQTYEWVRDKGTINTWPPRWVFQGGVRDFKV